MDNKPNYIAALIISGLVLPLILVLLVKFTGFTEIIEEIRNER